MLGGRGGAGDQEAAKEAGLQLIVGSEIQLADGPRLVLLAMDRAGYGNLCRLITRGRRAAPKGSYHLTRADLENGLPGCLALLLPEAEAPTRCRSGGLGAAGFPRALLAGGGTPRRQR
jgi:DNA polymerase III alpha subunit